jgi:hypothetical protein
LCFGGRPFGSGATRRASASAICRLKRASPSAHPPFVAARSAGRLPTDKVRIARRAEQLAVRLLPSDRIGPEPVNSA